MVNISLYRVAFWFPSLIRHIIFNKMCSFGVYIISIDFGHFNNRYLLQPACRQRVCECMWLDSPTISIQMKPTNEYDENENGFGLLVAGINMIKQNEKFQNQQNMLNQNERQKTGEEKKNRTISTNKDILDEWIDKEKVPTPFSMIVSFLLCDRLLIHSIL